MSKLMTLDPVIVEELSLDEMMLVIGGNDADNKGVPNNSTGTCTGTNNGSGTCLGTNALDGTCQGTNNESGKCGGTNNGSGSCGVVPITPNPGS